MQGSTCCCGWSTRRTIYLKRIHIGGNEIKISELQIALLDYIIETKQLKIDVYLPHYNELKHFKDLKDYINWIVMQIIGEITYSKHIKEMQLHQMPLEPIGLLPVIELPNFIEYLHKINSRKKTIMI